MFAVQPRIVLFVTSRLAWDVRESQGTYTANARIMVVISVENKSYFPIYGKNSATCSLSLPVMEEGTKAKKTVFVGNLAEDVNESIIYEHFQTFGMFTILTATRSLHSVGDIIEVQLPPANTNPHQPPG